MKDELTSPSHWPLARVTHVHPGPDQLVRVVTIRTASAEFDRPVHKLIRLLEDDSIDQRFGDTNRVDHNCRDLSDSKRAAEIRI